MFYLFVLETTPFDEVTTTPSGDSTFEEPNTSGGANPINLPNTFGDIGNQTDYEGPRRS